MANTYLSRTFSNSTDRKKWTISVWLKRSSTSGNQTIVSGNSSNNKIHFLGSNNTLDIVQWSGSYQYRLRTSRVFRDTSAWYHLVIAVDTTLNTADNRVRLYVNGVEETSFADRNNPSQNFATSWNDSEANFICKEGDNYFDGSMSHFHFCDGTALAPTVFGSTDSTTGEWKINTSPSFTLGNNGFTILKDGNTITDQSSNSNNFTLGGGTLTNTKDCPNNVFCTLNPLISTVPTAGTNNDTTGTLTNGNLTWTSTNAVWNSRGSGNMFVDKGKFYWETKMNSGGDFNAFIGISPTTTVQEYFDGTMGKTGNFAYYKNGQKYIGSSASSYGDSWVAGDIIGTALDATNSKLYFSKNGVWQNSGDPTSGSTGTGAIPIDANTLYTPRCTIHHMGMSFNFGNGFFGTTAITTNSGNGYAGAEGASKFNYQPPSGYSALSTKGLNN